VGDHNDIWRLEIENGVENQTLETMVHRFRLIHYNYVTFLLTDY